MIRTSPEIRGKLELRYDGRVVESLFVVTGVLQNARTEPLASKDMVNPIVLGYQAEQATFLQEPEIVECEPATILVDFVPAGNGYRVDFPLLNGGDRVTFRIVASGRPTPPEVLDGRYEGLSRIESQAPGYWRTLLVRAALDVLPFRSW